MTFWYQGKELDRTEGTAPPLATGDGLIMAMPGFDGAPRWRVVDVWVSYDHHGYFDDGRHVSLEAVEDPDDDLPKLLVPYYFADED